MATKNQYSKQVAIIKENMISKSTEELKQIWEENNRMLYSNEAFEAIRQLLIERGEDIDNQLSQKLSLEELRTRRTERIGGTDELENYITTAEGISRTKLNVYALIGVFIFGWLLALAYEKLGKGKTGWRYLIAVLMSTSLSLIHPIFGLIGIFSYITGWIYANVTLESYEYDARRRLAEIESEPNNNVNNLLEKGIILKKIFSNKDGALKALKSAAEMQGGDPFLLYIAGTSMLGDELSVENERILDTLMRRYQIAEKNIRKENNQPNA